MARVDCTDIVRLSQSAAIELITSTLGAYEGKIRAGEEALETGGQLWGYARRLGDDTFIHYVEHASVSVFAERTPISIADHDEELTVKRQAMSYMRPELALLGDYHSHPWRTREEVERGTLFEYSQDDAKFWRKADPYWTCTDS